MYNGDNIDNMVEIATPFQFTRTGKEPNRNRIIRREINNHDVQYCESVLL